MKTDRDADRKGPGRKPTDFTFALKVEFVEISDDEEPAFDAGIRLLLGWLHEAKELEKERAETTTET